MKGIRLFLIATAATAAVASTAQTISDYNNIITALVANCPEIKQLTASNKAENEAKAAENVLDNPTIEGERVWGRHDAGTKTSIGVSQEFAWPGVYRARAKAINASTRASELLEQSAASDKMLEIEQLVIDIVYQKKCVEVERGILDHMKQLEKDNLEGYEHGELTRLDTKKIEIERISAASSLREAQRTLDELYAQLESVTGIHDCRQMVNEIKDIPQGKILSEEEYERLIDTYDPRLAWLRAQSEAFILDGKAQVMAARAPGFSLGYAFEREEGVSFNGFSASMTLPVYSRRHVMNSARANALSAQIEAEASHMSTLAGMRSLRSSVTSMKAELEDYSDVFGEDNYASLLTTARQGGQLSNLQYLQELNFFLEASRARLLLEHEYVRSLAALNRYNSIATR